MKKTNIPVLVLTALLLISIGYIIYLKQTLFSQTERILEAKIEALEYKQMAELEAQRAEQQAALAIEAQAQARQAEMHAQKALQDAKIQFDLAVNSK